VVTGDPNSHMIRHISRNVSLDSERKRAFQSLKSGAYRMLRSLFEDVHYISQELDMPLHVDAFANTHDRLL